MRLFALAVLPLIVGVACTGGDASTPAPSSAGAKSVSLTAFEAGIIDPILEDVRAGIRPWDEQGIGICRGEKACDEFLGASPGALPPGKYILRAHLRVPNAGNKDTWKFALDTSCTTTRITSKGPVTSEPQTHSREYEARWAGPDRGYRLEPMRSIESPSKGGAKDCTYKIRTLHPDGEKVWEGAWSTPSAEAP